jgi:ribonuclease BN (tRNA processing enzyme)
VNHTISTVGFEITSKDGKKIFFTGDTGPGLSALWEHISPDLIIVDTTFPNKLESRAINAAHLCPKLLKKELIELTRVNDNCPKIILIHLSPKFEKEIRKEVKEVSKELNIPIEIASEGKQIII